MCPPSLWEKEKEKVEIEFEEKIEKERNVDKITKGFSWICL